MSKSKVVVRNGVVSGLAHPLGDSSSPVRLRVADARSFPVLDEARQAEFALLEEFAPGITVALTGPAFEELAAAKLEGMKAFWAKQGKPLVNERMPAPGMIIPLDDGSVDIVTRPDRDLFFNHVMAVRQLINDQITTKGHLPEVLARLQGNEDGVWPATPFLASTSLGVNVVRVAQSAAGPVALFTIQGQALSHADASGADSIGKVGSTGGAVCIDKTTANERPIDLMEEAGRELGEETGVGMIAGSRSETVAGITQSDLQFALFQIDDLRAVEPLWAARVRKEAAKASIGQASKLYVADEHQGDFYARVSRALDASGDQPTLEFFDAVRSLAPDAAEAQRYLPVPLTKEAFLFVGAHNALDFAPWTNVMLSELGAREFGPEFRDELAAATVDRNTMRDAMRVNRQAMPTEHVRLVENALIGQTLA